MARVSLVWTPRTSTGWQLACPLQFGGSRREAGDLRRHAQHSRQNIRGAGGLDAEGEAKPKRNSAGGAGAGREAPDIVKLWARARNRYGFTRDEFLSCSPCEFELLLQDDLEEQKERLYPAAIVCSVIANVNRDPERRPEPFQPADFMPGAKSEEDEMREFVEAIQRGDKFEMDPEEMENFKRNMERTFGKRTDPDSGITLGNLVSVPGEIVRTNAISGERPERGLL